MNILFLFFSLLLITGCDQRPQVRHYTEITSQAPDTSNPYAWVLPKGWKQGPDQEMRLASFYLEADPNAIDCSIVALPGMAGGVEANLKRWMGQIGIDASDDHYQTLLSTARTFATQGGLEAQVYDLMPLQKYPASKTMIAAIISTDDTTIFVKMTGTSEKVKENRDGFLEFVKSLGKA